jgi:hypothetical protein
MIAHSFLTQYFQVRDGDTEGISKAAKLIEALQGSSAGTQPPDAPGGVDDELADAIAAAAIDEGDDVDTLGKNLFSCHSSTAVPTQTRHGEPQT